MGRIRNNNQGFTIVELILALAFFSFVLLFAISGFIQINHSYNKGLTVKRIHETGRLVLEDISRVIHTSAQGGVFFSANAAPSAPEGGDVRRFCAGGVRLAWNEMGDSTREKFNGSERVINLARSQTGQCDGDFFQDQSESYLDSPGNANDPNLVYGSVIVYDLNFVMINDEAVRIELTLASSDPNAITNPGEALIDTTKGTCKGGSVSGDQFCDVVKLATTVGLRS